MQAMTAVGHAADHGGALPLWLQTTLVSATAMTVFDAFLLQEKKSFFTGGFLAVQHTEGVAETGTFLLLSIACDAAVAGILVMIAVVLTSRAALTPLARRLAAVACGLAPLLVADFVAYSLASYLGDAFDLALMFDLTGRHPSEFLAVASGHLAAPAVLLSAAGGLAGALVWAVNRIGAAGARTRLALPRRLAIVALALFASATIMAAVAGSASEVFQDGLQRKPSGRLMQWLTQVATDVDRDGYGIGGRMSDPAPFDAAIRPYALDTPGDGVDQDAVGGDLPPGPAYSEPSPIQRWQHQPNVVLIVLESFRADALGRIVNGKPVTPVLDELARQGASASAAFSQNGYTAQSRFHMFSGSIAGLRGGRTIIDDFKANGYEVAYFSAQDDSFGGAAYSSGFDRADHEFDARQDRRRKYSTFTTPGSLAVPYDVVQEHVTDFLAHRDASRPLFLYVNFHDTHYPYHHAGIRPLVATDTLKEAQIKPSNAQAVQRMYFNTAANVDAAVGATLDLVSHHLGGRPATIVMADHGESLFDEGFLGHGYALNDVQTRIPLIVTGLPMLIEQPFGQADLRDAVGAALAGSSGTDVPRATTRPGKTVFQYLGKIDRPRQIAFCGADGRTIYDFRTGRVQLAGGPWQRPAELQGDVAAQFLKLVRLWERMLLAKAQSGNGATADDQ